MSLTRIVKRIRAFRRYRACYIRTIDQLSSLTNSQLEDLGIDRWEIADRAHARARGLGAANSAAR